jgi:hypothetical protein
MVIYGQPFLVATPLILILVLRLIYTRRWSILAIVTLTSPFTIASGAAGVSYIRGTASLRTVGYPDIELRNVDPKTRLQTVSSGCLVSGGEAIWNVPNNLTLRLLVAVFGGMRGTFEGPYPNDQQARAAVEIAGELSWEDLKVDFLSSGPRRRSVHITK